MSKINQPIFITGCARSGTSMVAGIFARCGAWHGETTGPVPHNPKGQYENTKIRNNVLKPLLKRMGVDVLGQKPLPSMEQVNELLRKLGPSGLSAVRDQVENILAEQGYDWDATWLYKGAKMCLMWPIWDALYANHKLLIFFTCVGSNHNNIINISSINGLNKSII